MGRVEAWPEGQPRDEKEAAVILEDAAVIEVDFDMTVKAAGLPDSVTVADGKGKE